MKQNKSEKDELVVKIPFTEVSLIVAKDIVAITMFITGYLIASLVTYIKKYGFSSEYFLTKTKFSLIDSIPYSIFLGIFLALVFKKGKINYKGIIILLIIFIDI